MDLQNLENKNILALPVLALRGKVLFPKTLLNFDVGRPFSVNALNYAVEKESLVFIGAQRNSFIDSPKEKDICKVGVVAKIKQIIKMPNGNLKVNVQALYRAEIVEFLQANNFFMAKVQERVYIDGDATETEAYYRVAKKAFYEYTLFDKRITKEMLLTVTELQNVNEFIDNAISLTNFKEEDHQKLLEIDDSIERLKFFDELFNKELEISKIEKKINAKVRTSIDKSQKEFYLREQLKAIHDELGDGVDEIEELERKIKAKGLPKDIEEKALKEVARLDKINPSSPFALYPSTF